MDHKWQIPEALSFTFTFMFQGDRMWIMPKQTQKQGQLSMLDLGLISRFVYMLMGFEWKCGFWRTPTLRSCVVQPCQFCSRMHVTFDRVFDFYKSFSEGLFMQVAQICCQLKEPSIEPASWTLLVYNFGGYPKCLKWLSQRRPMIDLVRKSLPQMPDQPLLFLSLP